MILEFIDLYSVTKWTVLFLLFYPYFLLGGEEKRERKVHLVIFLTDQLLLSTDYIIFKEPYKVQKQDFES